jgi:hypothetical protein
MKQWSQARATGSVKTSNLTYILLPRADTTRQQAIAHRKILSPTAMSEVLRELFCYESGGLQSHGLLLAMTLTEIEACSWI